MCEDTKELLLSTNVNTSMKLEVENYLVNENDFE